MQAYISLRFHAEDLPGGPERILRLAGIGNEYVEIRRFMLLGIEQVNVQVALPEGDERIPKLIEMLKQHGQKPLEGAFDRYTNEELDNARLLVLRVSFTCQVDGGSAFGTTYDLLGACPHCGAGARQTSAMFLNGWDDQVRRTLEGHRAAQTTRDELLIEERIAEDLHALGLSGLLLHQVYAVMPDKRQFKLPWKQLSASHILPRMAPQTEGVGPYLPCEACPRGGYWTGSPTRVAYRRQDLEGACDVNLSWEGQHGGEVHEDPRKNKIPVPLVLVTPRVMQVFRAAGITEFEWFPIRVVDE